MMELAFPLTDHLVGSVFSLPSVFQIDCRPHAIIWAFQFLLTVADNSYTFCIQQPLIPFFFLKVCLCSVLCGFRNYGTASRARLDSKRNIARTRESAKGLLVPWVCHPSPHQLSLPFNNRFTVLCQFPPYNEVQQYMYTYIPFLLVLTSSSSFHPSILSEYRVELSVLYSRFLRAICFTHGSFYTSILISQFIPSNPPPASTSSCLLPQSFLHLNNLASVPRLLCFSLLLPAHC